MLRDWIEYRVDIVRFWLEDDGQTLREWACPHDAAPEYEEVRADADDKGFRTSWSACFKCPDCGKVLHVEASYYGNPFIVRRAVDEEFETQETKGASR